ncbi:uncharacterized protein B0P05DRAFT_454026, partial [Gilbertella persicaria]|uniref:uncharacterized protein n=1 Tax=Gilbertella persicaria TaxID=101096 RepID=UPI00222102DB
LFVGDRCLGVGSRVKEHRRYGGKWKQKLLGSASIVCITSEYSMSQTCVFCFQKLAHPVNRTKKATRTVKDAFDCLNKDCMSLKKKKATMSHERLSALVLLVS